MRHPGLRLSWNRRLLLAAVGLAAIAVLTAAPAAAMYRGWCPTPYPYWGWGGGWGGGWGAWGWGAPYYGAWGGYTVVYPMANRTHGALDLDVSPERAQVYINGDLAGVADDYDGFPDFLWLEKGTYDVVIYHPGFQTISRQISIYAGQVIDVEDRMVPGQETLPEDLVSKSTERRDERLQRDRELEEEEAARVEEEESASRPRYERRADSFDAREEPGRVVLRITPDDASVYLDGRFLGTGHELSRLRSGLIVDAGEHELEAVRPGFRSTSRSFSVSAGDEAEVSLVLNREE